MAALAVVWWRDIPAQVIAGTGRSAVRRSLGERFEKAIDRAAMRAGLAGTDDYLAQWRRLPAGDAAGDMTAAAGAAAARLEHAYTDARLAALVAAGGVGEREKAP